MEDKSLRHRFVMKPSTGELGVGHQDELSRTMERDLVAQIKQSMRESCGRADSIEHLCQEFKTPYHTVRKLFRRVEGISLAEYWQRCRLQKAEELLSNPSKYIFEVAYEMGFSSDGYFTNWFKKHKSMTPKEFRRHLQRGRE